MPWLLRLAMRNLVRNLRRSLITGSAISVGLCLLILGSAGTDGMIDGTVRKGVGALAGHVVVQGTGWQERREAELVVPDTPAVAARLADTLPGAVIVQRVFLEGLLTSPTAATSVAVTGVQPAQERRVGVVHERVVEGAYLDDDPTGIVVGRTLAESLGVGLGDKVVLMAQGPEDVESRLFRIRGVFSSGVAELDAFAAQVTLGAAQDLLGLGQDVTQVSAHLADARGTERAVAAARAALGGPGTEVLSWHEALPELAAYVHKEQTDLLVFFPVLWVMVGLGIVNTMLMSVLERTHELGVLLAIGLSHAQAAGLVLLEALLLGVVASAVGLGVALLINIPYSTVGLDMSAATGGALETAGIARDMVIRSRLDPAKAMAYSLGATGVTVVAALYPAWTVARMSPVEALRAV